MGNGWRKCFTTSLGQLTSLSLWLWRANQKSSFLVSYLVSQCALAEELKEYADVSLLDPLEQELDPLGLLMPHVLLNDTPL